MIWMLVIADDLTGALDTGVQFSGQGIPTRVGTDQMLEEDIVSPDIKVLVLNMETRYLNAKEAYEQVKKAVQWAIKRDIKIIYKKTDSVLRGNIGSELAAALETSLRSRLYFIPAFPKMKRYTIDGIQYLDDVPLAETELGKDVFEPISCSYIPDLIKQQSNCNTITIKKNEKINNHNRQGESKTIYICDAYTEQDIKNRLMELDRQKELYLLAGCAGCAEPLAEMLREKEVRTSNIRSAKGLLISCGSLNKVTEQQLNYLQKEGKTRIHLTEQLGGDTHSFGEIKRKELIDHLERIIKAEGMAALDTFCKDGGKKIMPELRFAIAGYHGAVAKELIERGCIDTVLMTGGDTLMGFMKEIHCSSINPVCELKKGVVLSDLIYRGKSIQVISKSGGFGNEKLLYEIVEEMKK